MSDYYHQFLTSMSGVGVPPSHSPNTQDAAGQLAQQPSPIAMASGPGSNQYQNLGYFTGFPDPMMFNATKPQRSRRKSAPGTDHIKHRRTRSGCYTCRQRRVKCDETHPICDRCKKGKRECNWPESATSKAATGSMSKDGAQAGRQESTESSDDDDDLGRDSKLDTILDEEESGAQSPLPPASDMSTMPRRTSATSSLTSSLNLPQLVTDRSQGSETPSLEGNRSSSPSASTCTGSSLTPAMYQFPDLSVQTPGARPDFSQFPHDIRFYLNYFYDNVTHYHYCIPHDAEDFFHTILPSIAVQHDSLLYAVVGFAAYHHTLQNPNGKMQELLQYYNKSVTLLLSFLKRKEKHNIATLLTILQLATIEEYFGDWINLMGHQKAALEVLSQLFTPQMAMQSATSRMIVAWYSRFDVFVALMGGFETALPRIWFETFLEHCREQIRKDPSNKGWKYEEWSARVRQVSMDMSMLAAKAAKGEISGQVFFAEHVKIEQELHEWKDSWDSSLIDSRYLVSDFGGRQPTPDDIVNPFVPGLLYDEEHFPTTVLICEWHSICLMHKMAVMNSQKESSAELASHAYAICQIFEASELWPHTPKGTLLLIQACLVMSCLFLPRDAKHHTWMRRKFALLELLGYIFPLTMRVRISELFNDPGCVRWWLPNDDGFTPILKSIRAFADERNATAVSAQTENLREIKHVFAKMQIGVGEGDSPGSSGSSRGMGKSP